MQLVALSRIVVTPRLVIRDAPRRDGRWLVLLPKWKQNEVTGNSPCGISPELIASARVCRRTLRS